MIARLARAAARRPGELGAVLVILGVWLTAVAVAAATGRLTPIVERVVQVLGGIVS